MAFREISVEELKDNPFTLINKDWMLITAGNREKHNTMTASWGGVGENCGADMSLPSTSGPSATPGVCGAGGLLFPLLLRAGLPAGPKSLCGSKSGREVDKDAATGLTPCFDQAAPTTSRPGLSFLCRKLYRQDLEERPSWTRAFWKSGTTTTSPHVYWGKL